jgi:hypothetical protein
MVHSADPAIDTAGLALRSADGIVLDANEAFVSEEETGESSAMAIMCQSFRFFNCDVYYTKEEVEALMHGLQHTPVPDRQAFFSECIRLRRRERNLWADTPLAKALTLPEEWSLLSARAKLEQMSLALHAAMRSRKLDPFLLFSSFDTDGDGCLSYVELQQCVSAMHLGYSPQDVSEIVRLADGKNDGKIDLEEYSVAFMIEPKVSENTKMHSETTVSFWQCSNCTFINAMANNTCSMCELGWTGKRECPRDKWVCAPEHGGCTFFNAKTLFYCEVCNRSRPDLASVRL